MTREAACQCGALALRCEGLPARVSLCHCLDCQRRTGTPFGIAAFFARDRVVPLRGTSSRYTRASDSGFAVTFHFCGACGSSVWWEPERLPAMIAVAVGAFADPGFPAPDQAVWDCRRHPWLGLPEDMPSHPRSPVRPPSG